jgi:DNA-binding IclR family transcriptional regulator
MKSIEAAMRILNLVDHHRPVLRVGEVSRELGLQKSTVSRLLRTLSEHEVVERERGGQGYVAGRRSLLLADLYLSAHTLLDRVEEAVNTLVAEFEFVGYAAALSGPDIVILRLKHGRYPLRLVREVGTRIPAWRTAIGRALLARQPDADVQALLKAMLKPAERAAAVAEIEKIRQSGVSFIESAIIPGIAAIGTSVASANDGQALGFALSYPLSATDKGMRELMGRRMGEEARRIGLRLGDSFWRTAEPPGRAVAIGGRPARKRSNQGGMATSQ